MDDGGGFWGGDAGSDVSMRGLPSASEISIVARDNR